MNKKKLILLLSASFLIAGCNLASTDVSIKDDINYDTDVTDDVIDDGEDNEFDETEVVEEEIETPSEYDSFTDNTITAAGKYYLKGTYPKIWIDAKKDTEIYIFLDGVSIECNEGIAFGSNKAITLHLVVLNNSTNTIINDFEDTNAFHVKGNVYITGEGTINITSKQKNGLKVSKNLFVGENISLNVKGYNHAITAQSITTNKATINVVSETKDGLQLECADNTTLFTKEEGYAYLVDTTFTSDTYGDGIQADTYVYITGGTYNITTHGEFISYSTTNMSTYELTKDDFKYVKSGNDYKRVAKDEIRSLSSSYYALKNSVKGIKAGVIEYDSDGDDVDDTSVTVGEYQVYIAHLAKLNINSTDDCVHANYGTVTIENSNLDLSTYDDGLHADYDLSVNNASISITKSYEGLEGANVVIDGEDTNIITDSEDDGINAASDLVSINNITIKNGYLRVYASGDGIDANSTLYLNGGTVIVEGPGRNNGSLDAEKVQFNGGIVLATSTSGMQETMTATQYTFVYQGSTIAAGSKISIVDENDNALFSYTLKQSCNQIIFSHKDMEKSKTYKIVSGTTQIGSVTMTSTFVKVGTSSGGGPGGGGPGGGGWGW